MTVGDQSTARWDFFVSYTQADSESAQWVAWQLEKAGYNVLLQAWDFVPGTNWINRMHEGLAHSARVILVLSPAYLTSVYAGAEWQAIWAQDPTGVQRRVVPVRVAECERPGLLAGLIGVDLFGIPEQDARRRLLEAVAQALAGRGKPALAPPPLGSGACPPDRVQTERPGNTPILPTASNVPLRNPNFTGRHEELARLKEELTNRPTMTVQAVRGMGGIGKTQTVIEYTHRYATDYDVIWWFDVEQPTAITDQIAKLAAELELGPMADPDATLNAVKAALRGRQRWLLIFDNAESAAQIRPLLPGGSGHVLITTRRDGFRALGGVLDLDILDHVDAVALLRQRAPRVTADDAGALAERLGHLPLALDQAAAYIDQTGVPAEDYLQLLSTRASDMLTRGQAYTYKDTVASVWALSIDHLRAHSPAAVELLAICAWLAPEPIPLDLFADHSDILPRRLAAAADDLLAFTETIAAVVDYSLARRTGAGLVVHRLVQEVSRYRLTADLEKHPLPIALALLRASLPVDPWGEPSAWPAYRRLVPHILAATAHHDDGDSSDSDADTIAWLLNRAGTYSRRVGLFSLALSVHQRALRIREAVRGGDHPEVASALAHVGHILSDQGRHLEALKAHQRALHIREADPGNPDIAASLNDVGWVLSTLGRHTEALPLHRRALHIRETALGPHDPKVATALNQVGQVLSDLGRPGEALPLQERSLEIREATFGTDHPYVATSLRDLGLVLSALGNHREALTLHRRALRIDEDRLGPDHTYVAFDLNNIGCALSALGRAAEALPLHRRAVTIHEAIHGPDHERVAIDINHVGRALLALGRPAEALSLFERALRIQETVFDPEHPDVALTLNNLGLALSALSRVKEALPLFERALHIQETSLGSEHPDVALTLNNLALALSALSRPGDAVAFSERSLRIHHATGTVTPPRPD